MEKPEKAQKLNLPVMGLFVKGIVTQTGVTGKNKPLYHISCGSQIVQLFSDLTFTLGEVVEISIRPFDSVIRASEAR